MIENEEWIVFYENKNYKKIIELVSSNSDLDYYISINSDLDYYIGMSYYHLNRYVRTIHYLTNFIKQSKNKEKLMKARFYIGHSLYILKKYKTALVCFKRISEDFELNFLTNFYKGMCNIEILDYINAFKALEISIYQSEKLSDPSAICVSNMAKHALIKNIIENYKTIEEIEICIQKIGKTFDIVDACGNSVLIYAIQCEDKRLIQYCLSKHPNLFAENMFGNSAITIAVDSQNEIIFQIIVIYIINFYFYK